jgi:integrase
VKSAWASVCKAAGVECRFHDLRHTVCSRMAETGKSKESIMEIMGHVSEAMYRRYCHRSAQSRRNAVLSLERPAKIPPQRQIGLPVSPTLRGFGGVQ